MHTPPAVTYPVGRSLFAARLAAGLLAVAGATLAGWAHASADLGWRHGLVAAVLLLCAAVAARALRDALQGQLRWGGDTWVWIDRAGEMPGRVARGLDLQAWLLLRWQPDHGRGAWLWLERHRSPHDWDALRRAVYSRARTEAPRGAEPPLAEP